jgi:SsrA-binding protein
LNKAELRKLERKISEKGMTIIPLKMYFSERGMIKLEIALATGKKSFDKRETLKEKDMQRDMDRSFRTR